MSNETQNRREFLKNIVERGATIASGAAIGAAVVDTVVSDIRAQSAAQDQLNKVETVEIQYGTHIADVKPMIIRPTIYRIPTALTKLSKEELADPAKVAKAFGNRLNTDDKQEVLGNFELDKRMHRITVESLPSFVGLLHAVITKLYFPRFSHSRPLSR